MGENNKIVREVRKEEYELIKEKYGERIIISPHAVDYLSMGQRGVFREIDLIRSLLQERPYFIGLQKNGRYSVIFRRTEGFMKIILEIRRDCIVIITFMEVEMVPRRIGRENGK